MKPKPFSALNHLTEPSATADLPAASSRARISRTNPVSAATGSSLGDAVPAPWRSGRKGQRRQTTPSRADPSPPTPRCRLRRAASAAWRSRRRLGETAWTTDEGGVDMPALIAPVADERSGLLAFLDQQ